MSAKQTKNGGRSVKSKFVLTSNEVNSYIDLRLKVTNNRKLDSDSPTGLPNSAFELNTAIKLNTTVENIAVACSEVQTIGELADRLNDSLSAGSCTFLEEEQVLRFIADDTGAIAVAVIDAGDLITGLTGTRATPIEASYSPGITGGGVYAQVALKATSENPVDTVNFIQVLDADDGSSKAFKSAYDRETGILIVRDNGSDEFTANDVISIESTIY